MMRGQRGWRELAVLGDKINKFSGMIEGLIWSPRGGDKNDQVDDWAFEEVNDRTLSAILIPCNNKYFSLPFCSETLDTFFKRAKRCLEIFWHTFHHLTFFWGMRNSCSKIIIFLPEYCSFWVFLWRRTIGVLFGLLQADVLRLELRGSRIIIYKQYNISQVEECIRNSVIYCWLFREISVLAIYFWRIKGTCHFNIFLDSGVRHCFSFYA